MTWGWVLPAGPHVSPGAAPVPTMPEPVATRTIVYWPALAPGVAQIQVAQFIAAEGADEVVVVVGRSRQCWTRAQADRVLAAFRQAGYPLEASVQAGGLPAKQAVPEEHTQGASPPAPD
jgi:hypothetical protein